MTPSATVEFKRRTVELIEALGLSHTEVIGLALSLAAAHGKIAGVAPMTLHAALDRSCCDVGIVASVDGSEGRMEAKARIAEIFRSAEAQGISGWAAVEAAFPGIPSEVVAEAWLTFSDEETAAWWSNVERTIDGEIVRPTLGSAGSSS